MTWTAIITAMLGTFGPLLVEWLKAWLEDKLKAAAKLIPTPSTVGNPVAGMNLLFDTAIGALPRVAFARRALLRRFKASAVEHAPEFAKGLTVSLSHAEIEDLRDAAGAAAEE